MGTPPKACQHPQSPKGTFPATPAASRDQRPWTAAGRRPSWGVLRSSWGLSPWQNPLEPNGTSTSRSGPDTGAGLEGMAAGRGQGNISGGTSGPARSLHQSQMLGGHEVPQDILHGTAWHRWPEARTLGTPEHRAPCQHTTGTGCFSQVCRQAQEGSWGWKACLQAAEACPGHCHCSAWISGEILPLTCRGGQQDANNTAKTPPWKCEMESPGMHREGGKRQLAWGSTDMQGVQLSHFQTN